MCQIILSQTGGPPRRVGHVVRTTTPTSAKSGCKDWTAQRAGLNAFSRSLIARASTWHVVVGDDFRHYLRRTAVLGQAPSRKVCIASNTSPGFSIHSNN
jgi:hypothetical protein